MINRLPRLKFFMFWWRPVRSSTLLEGDTLKVRKYIDSQNREIFQTPVKSSSETQGQSVGSGEGARGKFSSTGERASGYRLSPDYFQDAGSWLGTKNALYYYAQSANMYSFSWVIFVSSYTTAIVLPHLPSSFTKLLRARETFTFLTRNEGTNDESKNVCYQQFNLPREYSVFDSSQCIVNNRKLKMRRRRESQISNSLTRQNNNFARCISLFCTFLCRQLHDYPSKCLISCFLKDVDKQWQKFPNIYAGRDRCKREYLL